MNVNAANRGGKVMVTKRVKHNRAQVGTIAAMLLFSGQPLLAEEAMHAMPGMEHGSMQAMPSETGQGTSHSGHSPAMDGMRHSANGMGQDDPVQVSGSTMPMGIPSMAHGTVTGGSAVIATRDPHAYSGGYTLLSGPYAMAGPRQLRLADEQNFASLLVDRLEAMQTSDNTAAAYDMQAWFGRDYDRAVLRAEGHYDNGAIEEARTELLWGHAVATFWDTLVGLRYDSGEEPDRTWLALGVQGLAPYWFDVGATGYIGEESHSALSLNAEYELLFTQRLILQPRVEANFYGKEDDERGIGSGLSELAAGLRLRYEIRREFAPYVGAEWVGKYGGTADFARAAGLDTSETLAVAGVRFWF